MALRHSILRFLFTILAIEVLSSIPVALPTEHGKHWFATITDDDKFPQSNKKVMRNYKIGTELVDPKTLEPYYLKPVSGGVKVLLTFVCIGFDLQFDVSTTDSIWKKFKL